MKKALLFLIVSVLSARGMEYGSGEYGCYGQDPRLLGYPSEPVQYQHPAGPSSFIYDQYGNFFMYDSRLGGYVPHLSSVYSDQPHLDQDDEEPKGLVWDNICSSRDIFEEERFFRFLDWQNLQEEDALQQGEQQAVVPQKYQDSHARLKKQFSDLGNAAGQRDELRVVTLLNDVLRRAQYDIGIFSEKNDGKLRKENDKQDIFSELFKKTKAYEKTFNLIQIWSKNRDRIKGRFGEMLVLTSPEDSDDFQTGYEFLQSAIRSPDCSGGERWYFASMIHFCDELRRKRDKSSEAESN